MSGYEREIDFFLTNNPPSHPNPIPFIHVNSSPLTR